MRMMRSSSLSRARSTIELSPAWSVSGNRRRNTSRSASRLARERGEERDLRSFFIELNLEKLGPIADCTRSGTQSNEPRLSCHAFEMPANLADYDGVAFDGVGKKPCRREDLTVDRQR